MSDVLEERRRALAEKVSRQVATLHDVGLLRRIEAMIGYAQRAPTQRPRITGAWSCAVCEEPHRGDHEGALCISCTTRTCVSCWGKHVCIDGKPVAPVPEAG